MKRGVKITLPYTLCLFGAILCLGAVVMLTVAAFAYEDGRSAEQESAYARLRQALDQRNRDLSDQLNPAIQLVRLGQRWAASGQLDPASIDQWATLLLAPLADRNTVVDIAVISGKETLWHVSRSETGWAGRWLDHESGDIRTRIWDGDLNPLTPRNVANTMSEVGLQYLLDIMPPDLDPQEVEVLSQETDGGDDVKALFLVGRLSGHLSTEAMLVVALRPEQVETRGEARPQDVYIASDPGGLRMDRLAASHMKSLLTSQAVPENASLALRLLFPAPEGGAKDRWYAAQPCRLVNGYTWWSVASMEQVTLGAISPPLKRYAMAGMTTGLLGALIISIWMGRRVSKPLAQIARRANSIYDVDEHYLPWPKSRFSEVNTLTAALETLYESAVEHLDYHDAPLVVYAEREMLSGDDGIVDAHPLKRHINLRHGQEHDDDTAPAETGPVINVEGESQTQIAVPAAQLQVLHGARREVKRLQGQLAGSQQALHSADVHFQQSEQRLKRQRSALRTLDKQLQVDHAVRAMALETIRDGLGARAVTLWRPQGGESGGFTLRGSTDLKPDTTPLAATLLLRALLQEEFVASARDITEDPRFLSFQQHPQWCDRRCALLIAPLKFRGTVLGFLLAEPGQGGLAWKGDEEAFMASCAIQCTMALAYKQENGAAPKAPSTASPLRNEVLPLIICKESGELIHWETDLAGCLNYVEGDVAAIYGYDSTTLIGQPISFLSEAGQGNTDLAQLRRVLRGEPCVGYETCHQRADGLPVVLTIHAEIRRNAAGRIVGVRGSASVSKVPAV